MAFSRVRIWERGKREKKGKIRANSWAHKESGGKGKEKKGGEKFSSSRYLEDGTECIKLRRRSPH